MSKRKSRSKHHPLWIAAVTLVALPVVLQAFGLSTNTASMVVILAIATTALNLCVGYTGLVSFGHSIWFGLGAYAAALDSAALVSRTDLAADNLVNGVCCRRVNRCRNSYLAPARRVFLAADPRTCSAHLYHRVPLDRGDWRRDGLSGLKRGSIVPIHLDDPLAYWHIGRSDWFGRIVCASPVVPLAIRSCVGGDSRQSITRYVSGISNRPLQARSICALGGDNGDCRRPAQDFRPISCRRRQSLSRSPASCWRWS